MAEPARAQTDEGEPDPDVKTETDDGDLAAMIKPASGTVAKGEPEKHG
jgi:hypothetical protein